MKKRERGQGGLIRKQGCRYWYLLYYRDGRRIEESSHTQNKQEAEALLRIRMVDISRGFASPQELKQVKYADLRDRLLEHYRNSKHDSLQTLADGTETIWGLSVLDSFFGFEDDKRPGLPLTKITGEAARRFVNKRLAEPEFVAKRKAGDKYAGHAIINRSLSALRKMLTLFTHSDAGRGYIPPHIQFLPEPPARKGFISDYQFSQIRSRLPEPLQVLVTFLYHTGVRLGEAAQIQWEQVDLKTGLVVLQQEQTKNDEPRIIPLTPELVEMLRKVKAQEDAVFATTNLRKSWRGACVAAGLGKFIPVKDKPYDPLYRGLIIHDLRRSAIRNLVRAGVSETVAMKISGHKTASVFRRYNITSTDDIIAAAARLAAKQQRERKQLKGAAKQLVAVNP